MTSGGEAGDGGSHGGDEADAELELVKRRADRMRRARETRLPLWRHLAHVGVLGWLFILPALGMMLLGRFLERATGTPLLTVAGLVAGLALGALLVARSVRRSLREGEREDSP